MWWRKKRERDLEREIQSHLDLEAEAHDRSTARRAFGNTTLVKEEVRAMWGWTFWERAWRDLCFAGRMLRKSPGFTAVAVLSLALGIGANTAIFSLIDRLLLKMLPVQHPEQLVILDCLARDGARGSFSHGDYEWIRDRNAVFTEVSAVAGRQADWMTGADKQRIDAALVSGNFFSMLGVEPSLGRMLVPEDERRAASFAVISYGFWQRSFGLNPNVIGQTLRLGSGSYRIVGVTPPEFFGIAMGGNPDVWLPLTVQPQLDGQRSVLHLRSVGWLDIMARLRPTMTRDAARNGLAVLYSAIQEEQGINPRIDALNRIGVSAGGGGISELRNRYAQALRNLMGVVGLVLLIACANVSNLLLARAAARKREFAVRLAIGASRQRILRQLLTESLLLAAMAGGLGLVLGRLLIRVLLQMADAATLTVSLDSTVLAFTVAVSAATAVIFGVAPSLRGSRIDPGHSIKLDTRTAGGRSGAWSVSRLLVTGQVAICLVLLITAGLFLRSLRNLRTSVGFDTGNVIQASMDAVSAGYKMDQAPELTERLIAKVLATPGVRSASASEYGYAAGGRTRMCCIFLQGKPAVTDADKAVRLQQVSPGYFATLGIPLEAGREFSAADTPKSPEVAILNETAARRLFAGENPVGKRFGWSPPEASQIEIIGVVKDARYDDLRETTPPMVYRSMLQHPAYPRFLQARVAGTGASAAMADLRTAIQAEEPRIPIRSVTTMETEVNRSLGQDRLAARLAGAFGVLALALAAFGLYGVLSYAVTGRTAEIGIRIALGAQLREVKGMILREALILTVLGVAAGALAAFAARGLLGNQLFGLTAADPSVFLLSATVLVLTGAIAGYLPARRAARIDPMAALRDE